MAIYTGLSPQDALALWYQNRQKYGPDGKGATTPEEQEDYAGNFATLAKENPAAWMAVKTGQNDNGKTRQIFNPTTGGWDTQEVKGYWSHPESWIQALAGAGLGGTAAGLFGNAAAFGGSGGSAAASAPATATGAYGPMAEGYAGATTEAVVPGALDPAVGTSTDAALSAAGPYASGYQGAGAAADVPASLAGLSPRVAALVKALTGLGGLYAGHALGNAGAANAVPPQLSQLLDLSVQRANAQQPLFNAATSGLYQMLPDFAKSQGNK